MNWWRRRPEVRGESGYTETQLLNHFTRAISGNVPAVGALPQSSVVSITSVEQWSDAAAAYVTAEYVARPRGAIRVRASGTYRIEASVTPSLTYPTTVDEATARLYSYRQSYKPRRGTSELSDGAPPSTTGALMRSGAAESLRHIRTPGI